MGSNNGGPNPSPEHNVYLDSYWIDQTEVTNAMYEKCVQLTFCSPPLDVTLPGLGAYYGNPMYDNFPVMNVTWDQASNFCSSVKRHLPTEAQWEKAARGTDGRNYPWGNDRKPGNLNIMGNSPSNVGSFSQGASPYGALNMSGNAWEWVADWFGPYPDSSVSNPTGPSTVSQGQHITRGGGYMSVWDSAQTYFRSNQKGGVAGFRCALNATP
jgi:formylglycine-generating enzyme required for sulfatase activity